MRKQLVARGALRPRAGAIVGAAVCASLVAAGVGVNSAAASSGGGKKQITIAYEPTYWFFAAKEGTSYFENIAKEFEKAHPGVTVKLDPVEGTESAYEGKLTLQLRSSSTAPDVVEAPTSIIGLWAGAHYLAPLTSWVKTMPWWSKYPADMKAQTTFNGAVSAVAQAEVINLVSYSIPLFKQAGIHMPWHPTSWQEIVSAAKRIHKVAPKVTALWLTAGTNAGTSGVDQGIDNEIYGTSTPEIETKSGKMVVDSPGLRQAFALYKQVYGQGLGASTSLMFSPTVGGGDGPLLFPTKKVGICMCNSGYFTGWAKLNSAPYWPQAGKDVGLAALPRYSGGGVVSTVSGAALGVSKWSPNKSLAEDLVNLLEQPGPSVLFSNATGEVPPDSAIANSKAFTAFFPPFNRFSAGILAKGKLVPTDSNYSVWAEGMAQATEALADNPSGTSVSAAVGILKSYVTNQLGSSAVTTIR